MISWRQVSQSVAAHQGTATVLLPLGNMMMKLMFYLQVFCEGFGIFERAVFPQLEEPQVEEGLAPQAATHAHACRDTHTGVSTQNLISGHHTRTHSHTLTTAQPASCLLK